MNYQRNAVPVLAIQYVDNVAELTQLLASNNITFTMSGANLLLPGMLAPQVLAPGNWLVIQAKLPVVVSNDDFIASYSAVQSRIDTVELNGYTILLERVEMIRDSAVIMTGGQEAYLDAPEMGQFKVALNKWRDYKDEQSRPADTGPESTTVQLPEPTDN